MSLRLDYNEYGCVEAVRIISESTGDDITTYDMHDQAARVQMANYLIALVQGLLWEVGFEMLGPEPSDTVRALRSVPLEE